MPGSPPTACKLSAGTASPWGAEGGRFTGPGPRCRLACGTVSGTAPGSPGLNPPPGFPPPGRGPEPWQRGRRAPGALPPRARRQRDDLRPGGLRSPLGARRGPRPLVGWGPRRASPPALDQTALTRAPAVPRKPRTGLSPPPGSPADLGRSTARGRLAAAPRGSSWTRWPAPVSKRRGRGPATGPRATQAPSPTCSRPSSTEPVQARLAAD